MKINLSLFAIKLADLSPVYTHMPGYIYSRRLFNSRELVQEEEAKFNKYLHLRILHSYKYIIRP